MDRWLAKPEEERLDDEARINFLHARVLEPLKEEAGPPCAYLLYRKGMALKDGEFGLEADAAAARVHFERAASMGHSLAAAEVGNMCMGDGDYARALASDPLLLKYAMRDA